MAVLNSVGTVPEERDSFRVLVMMGRSESRCSKRSGVGMGSRSQDVFYRLCDDLANKLLGHWRELTECSTSEHSRYI